MTIVVSKLERLKTTIIPIIKCISCESSRLQLQQYDTILLCADCNQQYVVYNDIPIMTLQPEKSISYPHEAMVEHEYSPQWISLIEKSNPDLVLDFGSGNSPNEYSNLIKMEIFAFPNVDVVGFGEKLPFANDTFRTVFSGAVFEHVENPFACAGEIYNVLKEDGEVYIETAFLQPFHTYPNHYFNMTTQGLRKVMRPFAELEVGVQPHQNPSFFLSWILDVWAYKLSESERESFLSASAGEIIAEYKQDPFSQRWMSTFSDRDREDLACGVYFHGRKKSSHPYRPINAYSDNQEQLKKFESIIQQKNEHIERLETLLGEIERGRVMQLLNWLKRYLPLP